jgi:hypothetical protein
VSRVSKLKLPFADWPAYDQRLWAAAFEAGDRFDGCGPGAHLATATPEMLYERYARFLRFISVKHYPMCYECSRNAAPVPVCPPGAAQGYFRHFATKISRSIREMRTARPKR